ncbi:MAG: aminotransferase class I/II-fold pyridoxal phosphate-dependent enzyme, partial [Solirubrobacteraceae bacterium]
SYVGVISDLPAIVKRAHAAGAPVLVDQAWGAHLGLHPALPVGALRAGADGIVISAHKTLAAFTQGALVLARGGLLDLEHLDAAFELLNTTSMSASLAASIDQARRIMALEGGDLLERALTLAHHARGALADVDGLRLLGRHSFTGLPAAADFDPLKLVLLLAGTGADGYDVESDLNDAGVRVELADRDVLIPLLTIGDDEETVKRLIEALRESIARRRGVPRSTAAPSAWRVHPEMALTPREAFFARRERVTAERAVGRVSAETAAPYPPGIPVLAPGEVITLDALERLRAEAAAGTRVAYCSDSTLETLLVVRDE